MITPTAKENTILKPFKHLADYAMPETEALSEALVRLEGIIIDKSPECAADLSRLLIADGWTRYDYEVQPGDNYSYGQRPRVVGKEFPGLIVFYYFGKGQAPRIGELRSWIAKDAIQAERLNPKTTQYSYDGKKFYVGFVAASPKAIR